MALTSFNHQKHAAQLRMRAYFLQVVSPGRYINILLSMVQARIRVLQHRGPQFLGARNFGKCDFFVMSSL